MSKTYIIDGNSLLFRSFYASFFPGREIMRTKSGIPTNAIFTFHNMIMKLRGELKPEDRFFVAFDTGKKTFRFAELDTYKTNRKPIEPDLKSQLPIAREMLDSLNIHHFELDGYEGDDLAGSLATYASKKGDEVALFTSDKDFLQLLDDNVTVHFLRKGMSEIEIFTKDNIVDKLGITSSQIKDYKGLVGDPSDNLKGIPGVGEKTAVKLLKEYGTLENIIDEMAKLDTKTAKNIVENQDLGKQCKYLASIIIDLDMETHYEQSKLCDLDREKQYDFYKKYELNSFIRSLGPINSTPKVNKENKNITYKKIESLNDIKSPITAINPYLDGENYHIAHLLGLFFSTGEDVYYLDIASLNEENKSIIKQLKDYNTFDFKKLYVCLSSIGITMNKPTLDVLLASYLLDSNLNNDYSSIFQFYGVSINNEEVTLFDDELATISKVTYYTSYLAKEIIDKLKEAGNYKLYEEIELPLSLVLAKMEIEGFPISKEAMVEVSKEYKQKLLDISNAIYKEAGHEFNINSPKQVATILFDELNLRKIRKESTSVEVLNSLKDDHPIIPLIIEHRKFSKLVNSYTEGLQNHIFPDGKIHCLFNQALTSTGRLSSSEPNLQNIAIRSEEGKNLRKVFFYPDSSIYILSLDYSQIELRVLAEMANASSMIEIFSTGEDPHAATAAKVFNVPLDKVTKQLRSKAKTVNFGIVYGISDWGLSEQLHISPSEAHMIMNAFKSNFPELSVYNDKVVEFAQKNGYVKTYFGRRRYIEEINSPNKNIFEFAKRAAINATIQGTAADIIKMAMIKIDEELNNLHYQTKLILTIHDELLFKVPEDEKDKVFPLIKNCMENIVDFKVKLLTDGSIGKTWFDAK